MVGLTARQRAAPAATDRYAARRGVSAGGRDVAIPYTVAPGIEDDKTRYPGTQNDVLIRRDRGPHYHVSRYMPPPRTEISWTAAGPARPELGMRQVTLRPEVGASRSRFPYVPGSPTGGRHTQTPSAARQVGARYQDRYQMIPGRPDRLSPGQYSGQTYSATTRVLRRRA
jgi:hypothetical protein